MQCGNGGSVLLILNGRNVACCVIANTNLSVDYYSILLFLSNGVGQFVFASDVNGTDELTATDRLTFIAIKSGDGAGAAMGELYIHIHPTFNSTHEDIERHVEGETGMLAFSHHLASGRLCLAPLLYLVDECAVC